jgi:hypothetical protein
MSSDDDGPPAVPITCPRCETTTRVPLPEVVDAIEAHNAGLHDGEAVAEVDPAVADRIADLAADDLGLRE